MQYVSSRGRTSTADDLAHTLSACSPQAIAAKLGIESPTLADVASVSGVAVTLAATSLARRAPVYLTSGTHPNMLVRDALRGEAVRARVQVARALWTCARMCMCMSMRAHVHV